MKIYILNKKKYYGILLSKITIYISIVKYGLIGMPRKKFYSEIFFNIPNLHLNNQKKKYKQCSRENVTYKEKYTLHLPLAEKRRTVLLSARRKSSARQLISIK